MNVRKAALFLMPIAFLGCLVWALRSLANLHSLWSLMILCSVNLAVIATVWFIRDRWQGESQE
jgi:hypothetical protein